MENKQKVKKGFTLIELLVVVLIIGILAAVAVPQYQKAVYKSRYAALKNLVESIAQAQEIYYLSNDEYTTKFSDLDIDVSQNGTLNKDENRYTYEWGVCAIGGSNKAVACKNEQINLTYQKYFVHADVSYANKRNCIALKTNHVANEVCKSETGRSTFTSETDTNNSYTY